VPGQFFHVWLRAVMSLPYQELWGKTMLSYGYGRRMFGAGDPPP